LKGGDGVKEQKKIIGQEEDSREFVELLKALSDGEKTQVKGIMIGLMIARQQRAFTSPEDAAIMQMA
jgi:hypothetical protein